MGISQVETSCYFYIDYVVTDFLVGDLLIDAGAESEIGQKS
jgi:hypothetical protein